MVKNKTFFKLLTVCCGIPLFSSAPFISNTLQSSTNATEAIETKLFNLASLDNQIATPSFNQIDACCTIDKTNLTVSIDSLKNCNLTENALNMQFKQTFLYEGATYTITSIGNSCFSGTGTHGNNLASHLVGTINFTNKIKYIGDYAFSNLRCDFFLNNLENIVEIGNSAFDNCPNMDGTLNLYTDHYLKKIGSKAFAGSGIEGVTFPSKDISTLEYIGAGAFSNCKNLSGNVSFEKSIDVIGADAFKDIKGFSNISFNWNSVQLKTLSIDGSNALPILDTTVTNPVISVPNSTKYEYKLFFEKNNITTYQNLYDYFSGPDYVCKLSTLLSNSITDDCNVDIEINDSNSQKTAKILKLNKKITVFDLMFKNSFFIDGEEYKITEIADQAFENQRDINGQIVFPKYLERIGNNSFSSSLSNSPMKITSIDFSNCSNLLEIGESAFLNCSNLAGKLDIPSSLNKIGNDAFKNSGKFTIISFNWDNSQLDALEIGNSYSFPVLNYDEIPSSYISVPLNNYESYINFFNKWSLDYVDHILSFEEEEFNIEDVIDIQTTFKSVTAKCEFDPISQTYSIAQISNTSIVGQISGFKPTAIHNGIEYKLTNIGDDLFYNCANITGDILFPNTITSIGNRSFSGTNITSISTLEHSKLQTIEDDAFSGCVKLSNVDIDDSNSLVGIGARAFEGCKSLSGSFYIPATVYKIGTDAFKDTGAFNKIYFNWDANQINIVTNISETCLPNISAYGNIYISNSLYSLYMLKFSEWQVTKYREDQIFSVDFSFKPSEIIDSKYIYNDTFVYCTVKNGNQINIVKGDDDLDIHDLTFKQYFKYGDIGLIYRIYSIGDFAFQNCTKIDGELVLPISLNSIGNFAFSGSPSHKMKINSINLKSCSNLKSIGSGAFQYCSSLSGEINIPNSVVQIGSNAFYETSSVKSVYLNWNSNELKNNSIVLSNDDSLPNLTSNGIVHVPKGTKQAYIDYFARNNIRKYSSSQIVDDSVESQPKWMFYAYCIGIGVPSEIILLTIVYYIIRKLKYKKNGKK